RAATSPNTSSGECSIIDGHLNPAVCRSTLDISKLALCAAWGSLHMPVLLLFAAANDPIID
ncbi:MAG TPA: hypothetical protein VGL97_09935, partial [Bryobacteraceae bacterium]